MDKVLLCDCGFEARGVDERELVVSVQRHALSAHAMTLTREQVLVLLLRSELESEVATVPSAKRPGQGGRP